MPPQRVNYDTIAHLYDEPLRNHDVDQHLIAYLAEGKVGEIVSLVVKPPARGTGIGKGLLQKATEWLQTRGCAQIRVRANENRAEAQRGQISADILARLV